MTRWSALSVTLLGMSLVGLAPAQADVLELRDGTRLEGELRGASEDDLDFETAEGIRRIPVDQAAALHFGGGVPNGAATQAPQRPSAAMPPAAPPVLQPSSAPEAAPAAPASEARHVQLAAGTKLRVRLGDTIDPRRATKGDRFSALLETPVLAGALTVVPARSTVYGVITAASLTGTPANRLQLELKEIQISGQPVAIVTGTHDRVVAPSTSAPANASTPGDARLPSGAVLEFRLLQPLELVVRTR